MENDRIYKLDTFKVTNFNVIIYILTVVTFFLLEYFSLKFLEPFILFIIFFVINLIEVNLTCKINKQPISELFNKSIILLSSYLYFQYTIRCLPIIQLTIEKVFDMKYIGDFIRISISFLFMLFANYIFYYYLKNDNKQEPQCRLINVTNNMIIELIMFVFIIINTYLTYFFKDSVTA